MKESIQFLIGFLFFSGQLFSQSIDKLINVAEVKRIETVLSHDSMQGRRTFTQGIDKAAGFISSEFEKSRLHFLPGLKSYRQEFSMIKPKLILAQGNFDETPLLSTNIIALSTEAEIIINNNSGYQKVNVSKDSNFRVVVSRYLQSNNNLLVIVDTSFSKNFTNLTRLIQASFKKNNNIIFILSPFTPEKYNIHIKQQLVEQKLTNIVGVLPGKRKKNEYVVYSAHYDHLGIGKPDAKGDSIYNGANDNAAGTSAVIMLAKYFSKVKQNKRSLVFIAFTAEEIGGFGSQYFSKQLPPEQIIAMLNIEMIGTESKWGKNSAYITGYERSDLGKMLQNNLVNSKFRFEPDPYPDQDLFFRSDNASLARVGVPAHTISTGKMERPPNNEPNYHQVTDEIGTLDMVNMVEIIKVIALSSKTIISGKNTPSRVTNATR